MRCWGRGFVFSALPSADLLPFPERTARLRGRDSFNADFDFPLFRFMTDLDNATPGHTTPALQRNMKTFAFYQERVCFPAMAVAPRYLAVSR